MVRNTARRLEDSPIQTAQMSQRGSLDWENTKHVLPVREKKAYGYPPPTHLQQEKVPPQVEVGCYSLQV
jgi:hypothetical protein